MAGQMAAAVEEKARCQPNDGGDASGQCLLLLLLLLLLSLEPGKMRFGGLSDRSRNISRPARVETSRAKTNERFLPSLSFGQFGTRQKKTREVVAAAAWPMLGRRSYLLRCCVSFSVFTFGQISILLVRGAAKKGREEGERGEVFDQIAPESVSELLEPLLLLLLLVLLLPVAWYHSVVTTHRFCRLPKKWRCVKWHYNCYYLCYRSY